MLTHWGRATHISVGNLTIIGSDNGLSPDRRQAIIWTNARLLSIAPLRIYFNENLIEIQQFSLKKTHVKLSSAKWRPSCLGLNVLNNVRYELISLTLETSIASIFFQFIRFFVFFSIPSVCLLKVPLYIHDRCHLVHGKLKKKLIFHFVDQKMSWLMIQMTYVRQFKH